MWLLTDEHPVWIHPPLYWSQILWLLLLWHVSSRLHPTPGCCWWSLALLPSSKTKLSMLQMVLITTVVTPTVLMAMDFLSSISNVWDLLAATTPFSGNSVGRFWLMPGISADILMMKQSQLAIAHGFSHSHSLLTANSGMRYHLGIKVLNCGYRSILLTVVAHLMWAQKLVSKFCLKNKCILKLGCVCV